MSFPFHPPPLPQEDPLFAPLDIEQLQNLVSQGHDLNKQQFGTVGGGGDM